MEGLSRWSTSIFVSSGAISAIGRKCRFSPAAVLSVAEQDPYEAGGKGDLSDADRGAEIGRSEKLCHGGCPGEGSEQKDELVSDHHWRCPSMSSPAMLTDYHVHLRPDEDETDPAGYWFTSENVDRYLESAGAAGIAELGCAEHIYRFSAGLDLWSHPFWERYGTDDLDAYCEFVRTTPLKLGVECDFVPGAEDKTRTLLEAREFDFVLGSVHFVGDEAVDLDEFAVWETRGGDPDKIWRRYFETVAEAVRSGLFDILAHADLVKVWGRARPGPERDPRFYYEPAVEALAESGTAVEISTAGLRKPTGEIYPSPAFAEMCAEAGVPFALSSDAHVPEQLGYRYDLAAEMLGRIGVDQIAVFDRRVRTLRSLGTPVAQGAPS